MSWVNEGVVRDGLRVDMLHVFTACRGRVWERGL